MTALAQQLSSAGPAEAAAPRQVLEHLRFFPALARVRNPALANFPEPERRAFWQEVEGLLREEICP